jgi:alpha-galactosidase
MLPTGIYRGELYDIGFDKPEAHVVEKSGRLYYAFYAPAWSGDIALRGLAAASYRIRDYINDRDLGVVTKDRNHLNVKFEQHLLLEATPA